MCVVILVAACPARRARHVQQARHTLQQLPGLLRRLPEVQRGEFKHGVVASCKFLISETDNPGNLKSDLLDLFWRNDLLNQLELDLDNTFALNLYHGGIIKPRKSALCPPLQPDYMKTIAYPITSYIVDLTLIGFPAYTLGAHTIFFMFFEILLN